MRWMFGTVRRAVANWYYVATAPCTVPTSVYDEMEDDDLFVFDLEQCVYTGTIIEGQWDAGLQDWKYIVYGKSSDEEDMAVVAQIARNRNLVFITTYRL